VAPEGLAYALRVRAGERLAAQARHQSPHVARHRPAGEGAGIHPASFDLDALRAYRRAPPYRSGTAGS
jgi:hypothetical protein